MLKLINTLRLLQSLSMFFIIISVNTYASSQTEQKHPYFLRSQTVKMKNNTQPSQQNVLSTTKSKLNNPISSSKKDGQTPLEKKTKLTNKKQTSKPKTGGVDYTENSISLVSGKGTKQSGGGPGGYFWHIYVDTVRAGKVFINFINTKKPPVYKSHPSIQIFLNKNCQGLGIGRVAYRLACERSKYDEIYAHMRKSNLASKKAALYAGFHIVNVPSPQLILKWVRKGK